MEEIISEKEHNMEQQHHHKSVALVIGITGMVGLSVAEALKSPTALGGPWKVYGIARRSAPKWFPSSIVDNYIAFDTNNIEDTKQNLSPIAEEVTHVFWVAIQVGERESEEDNISINCAMIKNVLNVLTSSPSSSLQHVTLQTGSEHYLGPIVESTKGTKPVTHEPPFHEDMARLPYPNLYYSLEDVLDSFSSKLTWSVHRPSIIIGGSPRTVYNMLLTLAVYASICRFDGSPFRYPGSQYTWDHFCDASDARVLAEQQIWAAVTDNAKNQAFNCTNGDVFSWMSFWKELCTVFDLEFVEEVKSFDWVGEMKMKRRVWDSIVEEYGLYETKLEEITCFEGVSTVLHFDFQHVCSMNKSRDLGFFKCVDTLKSLGMWVARLREMKIIPRI